MVKVMGLLFNKKAVVTDLLLKCHLGLSSRYLFCYGLTHTGLLLLL